MKKERWVKGIWGVAGLTRLNDSWQEGEGSSKDNRLEPGYVTLSGQFIKDLEWEVEEFCHFHKGLEVLNNSKKNNITRGVILKGWSDKIYTPRIGGKV